MFLCSKSYLDVEQRGNEDALKHYGPRIALCPDWRKKNGKYYYFQPIIQYYRDLVALLGGKLVVIGFDDKIEDWKDKLEGLIIPGGRDVDPQYYRQKNTDASFDPDDAAARWKFSKSWVTECNPQMPILGVCYGFQAINCIFGGDLLQTMANGRHTGTRAMTVKPGSFLYRATGNKKEIPSVCYHHQGIGRLAPCLEATGWDKTDKTIHAFEYTGQDSRPIYGVLWHPEACYAGETIEQHEPNQLALLTAFVQTCSLFRIDKDNSMANKQ